MDKYLNKIVCMDARDLLRELPDKSVDMILTDPPYGILHNISWDKKEPDFSQYWPEINRIIKPEGAIVITAKPPFSSRLILSNLDMYRYTWYFEKPNGANVAQINYRPMMVIEEALVFSQLPATFAKNTMNYYPQKTNLERREKKINRATDKTITSYRAGFPMYNPERGIGEKNYNGYHPRNLLYSNTDAEIGLHPTQKSTELFGYFIKTYTQENDLILDPFCGSGTTAISARNLNRRFICGDLSPEYVAMANERLINSDPFQDTTFKTGDKQLSLFAGLED